jgi:hypothetical protein
MKRKFAGIITALVFTGAALSVGALALLPGDFLRPEKAGEPRQPRIINPRTPVPGEDFSAVAERLAREDRLNARVALGEGETIITVLNGNFDGDPQEEQIIAYRFLSPGPGRNENAPRGTAEIEGPVYITYVDYDEDFGGWKRRWSAQSLVTRPLTLSLYTQDLVGDRSVCVLVAGMNGEGERTLTVFKKTPESEEEGETPVFVKIAEFQIEGSISVQETDRAQAYQLGLARGQSFPLIAYGRDQGSANLLDQLEITYTYNGETERYEQSKITRLPGKELEQRRVRELLGGSPGAFESFIAGLWYYVSPQGTLDSRQYIYFDPLNRELIFYGDETQQVFTWQNSSATRYGLYISSQNISVTTLRRFLDIELESLDSIRVKVFEDVRLKIGVNAPWDGSYRKATVPGSGDEGEAPPLPPYREAVYEGSIGRLRFSPDGSYELTAGGTSRRGKYVFFPLGNREILELRSTEPRPAGNAREIFLVERLPGDGEGTGKLILQRARLGARGIQELHEPAISLMQVF